MTAPQTLVRTALVCGVLGALLFGFALRKIDPLPLNQDPPRFDTTRAFGYMRDLSKGFPDRVTWGEPRKRAAVWLKGQLRELGYEPKGLNFSETIAGRAYNDLEDVYAEKPGSVHPEEIVALVAHYDVAEGTHEGAMDDASGVGIVLELARVFAREHPERTILFLLTDSEEFGAFWGARAFARNFDRSRQIVAALNFDFVAPEKQTVILQLGDGLKQGFTPLWLRELALNSLRSLHGPARIMDFTNVMEFIERAMQVPPADHGAFLAEGIPSFNWVGQTDNFAYEMAHYHHTRYDVVEAMRPESLTPFGQGAERLVRSIDGLARIPEDFRGSSYWKVTDRYTIDGWAVTLLHILAFIPFLAYSLRRFRNVAHKRVRGQILPVVRHEAKNIAILLGSLLLGYVVMLLLPALRIITAYETFPATQKSPYLYSPDFLAILGVIASVVGVYLVLSHFFAESAETRVDSSASAEIRHAIHAALLALTITLAFLKNTYLGVLLLLPPAYLWTALRTRKRTEDRILNGLLILGGSITFVALILLLTTVFHVGVFYWYIFLSAAYGLISAYTVVLFFMALTVMIRLFKAFVL